MSGRPEGRRTDGGHSLPLPDNAALHGANVVQGVGPREGIPEVDADLRN